MYYFNSEMYDLLRSREDCEEGTVFWKSYLDHRKDSSSLANFLTRTLDRIDFRTRKNSIGQVVPDSWRSDAEAASKIIQEKLKDCEIIVNADQTFIKLHMENDYVLAPAGTKRVGGKVNPNDKKAGFTFMVTIEMFSNLICPPFLVFNGTKKSEAKRPTRTLDHK